ncbi:hypothetical protein L2750_12835 [Shewanella submarina]|uniref:Helicase HerA central domain-containing protein n=1 Tax=Shewanella submarina TaxID=2016376 RepID=A0ABV7GE42_9GAMM|nr:hypothetical protein [Shewanella submarina]MCL1038035.1 hypothetical protein [Shewanella submarina]
MPKKRVDVSRKADLRLVCGGTGSGKSSYVKQEIKRLKPSRLLIWDPVDEYGEVANIRITSPKELADLLKRYPHGALKVRFVAEGREMFEFWAACAFAWCNACLVAEELADVTTAGKAPPHWGMVIRRGRARGLAPIFALTQRPSESDKTTIGNATLIRCGRMSRADDRKYMAKELDIEITKLKALQPLEYIQLDTYSLNVIAGKL